MNRLVSPIDVIHVLDFLGFFSKYIILLWVIFWFFFKGFLQLLAHKEDKGSYYRVNRFVNKIKHHFFLINILLLMLYFSFFIYKPLFSPENMVIKYSFQGTISNLLLWLNFFTIIWDIKKWKASKIKKMEYHLFLEKHQEAIMCKVLHKVEYFVRFKPLESLNHEDYKTVWNVHNDLNTFSVVSLHKDISIGKKDGATNSRYYLLSYANGIRKHDMFFVEYNFNIDKNCVQTSSPFKFDFESGESKIVIYCKNFLLNVTKENITINGKKNEEDYNLCIKKIDNCEPHPKNPKNSISVIEIHKSFHGHLSINLTDEIAEQFK